MYEQSNITYIDDLPDLEDLDSPSMMDASHDLNYVNIDNKLDNAEYFIRPHKVQPFMESGMRRAPHSHSNYDHGYNDMHDNSKPLTGSRRRRSRTNCMDIAEHIGNCPMCSKFYKTDTSLYVISIIILIIICILLAKKILDL